MHKYLTVSVAILGLFVAAGAARFRSAAQGPGERGVRIKVGATSEEVRSGRLPQRRGVIIGVSRYQYGDQDLAANQIANLKYAADDAQAIYDFLRSEEGGGFRDEAEGGHLILLKDEQATKGQVERALASLKDSQPEDYFVLYIATHGVIIPEFNQQSATTEEVPYFILHDTYPDEKKVAQTGLRMDVFRKLVSEIPARKGLILSDTCHSAGVQMGGRGVYLDTRANSRLLEEMKRVPQGVGFISAAGQTEKSYEPDDLKHGVFTYSLLEGLRGNADRDQDRMVTFSELVAYLLNEVPSRTEQKQHPHYNTDVYGANNLPLSVVRYAEGDGEEGAAPPGEYGTLVLRAPGIDEVGVALNDRSVGTLDGRVERTLKVRAGQHQLSFTKGARKETRPATVRPGESLVFEVNITFSESDEDPSLTRSGQQINIYLRDEREPAAEASELYRRGVDEFKKQKFAEAIELLNRALQVNGGAFADALVFRGRAEESLGRRKDAVASFGAALQLRPTDYETRTLLADARFRAGDNVADVEQELRTVIKTHPNFDYARVILGDLLFWRGDLIGAETQLRRAIVNNPNSPPAHMILADVLTPREEKEKRLEAVKEAERALQLFDEVSRKQVSFSRGLKRLSLSHVVLGGGRYASEPALAEAHHILAKALTGLVERDETLAGRDGYLDRARTSLQEAARLAQSRPDRLRQVLILNTSAQNYLLQGQAERAIAEAERALKQSEAVPDSDLIKADAYLTLSAAYRNSQKYAKAVDSFRKFMDLYRRRASSGSLKAYSEELELLIRQAKANGQLK
ncbi:MAG TPA: tetratricopeptide repeat protein [Blastocatellia bacterium]|nr:tetratricopeptide repeat protein [Blastocatellia bacterium]